MLTNSVEPPRPCSRRAHKVRLPDAAYFPSFAEIAAYVKEHAGKGDMILTMGAGDIDKIAPLLLPESQNQK